MRTSGTDSHNPTAPIAAGIETAAALALHITMAVPGATRRGRSPSDQKRAGAVGDPFRRRPTTAGAAATVERHPTQGRGLCSVRGSLAAQLLAGASLGQDRNEPGWVGP